MIGTLLLWTADALVMVGLLTMTIAIFGMVRMPDLCTRLHAANMASVLGIFPPLLASATSGEAEFILRAILIGAFLLLTTPVSVHAIAHASYRHRPGAGEDALRRGEAG